jgi:hypothetical protein
LQPLMALKLVQILVRAAGALMAVTMRCKSVKEAEINASL